MFGQPDPSALEILWTLYRKVKGSRWLLGHLSLTDNSLSSDGESRAMPAPRLPTRSWRRLAGFLGENPTQSAQALSRPWRERWLFQLPRLLYVTPQGTM